MKKVFLVCLFLAAVCLLPVRCTAEAVAPAGEEAEWTVLFYICGADLETKHSCATETLKEIGSCYPPDNIVKDIVGQYGGSAMNLEITPPGKINVLLATGGANAWHTEEQYNIDPREDCLQYWSYTAYDYTGYREERRLPLVSMADPETLTEFIRWGVSTHPARKYALVLWGHGGGAKSGVLIDEVFDCDTLRLNELKQALADSGTMFEAVLFDACLMANLETAWAIHENARWMIASEEMVSGKGTAVSEWLQQLYYVSGCDGLQLGRWICDMTQVRYVNDDDEEARSLMTWSVIDLAKAETLVNNFDKFFEMIGQVYEYYPYITANYAHAIFNTETYGVGGYSMHDLAGMLYQDVFRTTAESSMQLNLMEALTDAVVYCIRGNARPEARGLSFCLATGFSPEELDIYADNCPSPHYLAFLDAISPWTAPDRVYEKAKRLKDMNTLPLYQIRVRKITAKDGTPALFVPDESKMMIGSVRYHLYRKNEESGQIVSLGVAPAYFDLAEQDYSLAYYRLYNLAAWPVLDGELCEIQMLNEPRYGLIYDILFNIPMRINTETMYLRCAFLEDTLEYEVYGIWEGYDTNTALFNRNVKQLAQYAGQEYCLLYPVYTEQKGSGQQYEFGQSRTLYRGMSVTEEILPAGTYYLDYLVYDVFQRPITLDRAEMQWDGAHWTMPEGSWTGEQTLDISSYYGTGR